MTLQNFQKNNGVTEREREHLGSTQTFAFRKICKQSFAPFPETSLLTLSKSKGEGALSVCIHTYKMLAN